MAPFTVYCDMTDKKNIGVTVISHNSEDRTLVQACTPVGCYQRDIHYTGANFLQLGNLTTISAHCEQFIKYECFGSMIFRFKYSWWLSRHEDQMTYWGGSNSTYPYKCACGVTGTCADVAYGCNCDNKQLLDEVEHDIMNYQNRGLCYLAKPKAEAENTDPRF